MRVVQRRCLTFGAIQALAMRTLDKWLKCTPYSAPAVMQAASSGNSPASKRSLGLRAPADYRTEQLIEEIRKNPCPLESRRAWVLLADRPWLSL